MRAALLAAALLLLACAGAAGAASTAADPPHAAHKASPDAKASARSVAAQVAAGVGRPAAPPADAASAGVDEKLGGQAALDVTLATEDGTPVRLAELVTMPTIIAPVYYSCPNECNVLLGTLATVLPQVGLRPGVEYQVLAVSFDERDTPAAAAKRKADFFNTVAAGFPPQAWRFLTGSEADVRRLMDSLGFHYARVGDAFRHSITLIALSPKGTITRYLYGIRPLAFDIAMAATEAGEGRTGLSVKRAIAMCYTYDPQGRRYVFDVMKVAGAGVLLAIGAFGAFLAFGGRKRRPPRA